MITPPRSAFLRSSLGRIAVTGAATLATVFAVTPAAIAADDVAPEAAADESPVEDAPTPSTTVIAPA